MSDAREIIARSLRSLFEDYAMREQIAGIVLSALNAAGLAVVSREATAEMLAAGNANIKHQMEHPEYPGWAFASTVWIAMLSASQSPAQAQEEKHK